MSEFAEGANVARWKRLGDMLMEGGLITRGQLDEGLAEKDRQKCFLGQALVRLGYLTQDELISFLVKQCKIPHINLIDYTIDPRIVRLLPNELCLQHKLIPIDNLGTILTIAMVNPLDLDALELARAACPSLKLKPILCTPEHFETVAHRLLISEENTPPQGPHTVSLASYGLKALLTPAPAASPPLPPSGSPPVLTASDTGDDFSILVREMLGELLSLFQGPVQGGPEAQGSPITGVFSQRLEFSFTLGLSGDICYASPGVTAVMGYEPTQFQSRFLSLLTDHPANSVLRRAIILSKSGLHQAPIEAEFRAADGTLKMLLVALIPVFDATHKLVAVQGVARDISRRERTEQQLFQAATHDPLTGLHNRRSFLARLDEAVRLATRHKTPVSVGVINLDNFTRMNQEFGNGAGDKVLVQVGRMLRDTLRAEDIIARSGGDEFCVLMPQVPPDAASHGLVRCQQILAGTQLPLADGRNTTLAATAGLVSIQEGERDAHILVERARALVMQGKIAGGNRVVTDTDAS